MNLPLFPQCFLERHFFVTIYVMQSVVQAFVLSISLDSAFWLEAKSPLVVMEIVNAEMVTS